MRFVGGRALAIVCIAGLVAAGCSKPKSATEAKTTNTAPKVDAPVTAEGETTDTSAPDAQAAQQAGTQTQTATAAGSKVKTATGLPGGTPVDEAQLKAVGSKVVPQSTQRRKPYYSGVGENTITLDFSIDATSCGVNVVNALTAAGGALPTQSRYYRAAPTTQDRVEAETRESIDVMVKYWNAHAFDAGSYYPNIRSLMGDDVNNQFYGRHLVANIIDGGSNQCPDKTTAAAKQAVNEHHAFIVFNNYDGAQYNMAAALNTAPAERRPMHFGTLWQSDQVYSKWAPFAWTQFATGSTITRQWASWICSRLRTGEVPGRAPGVDPKKRVFGLVHTNLQQDKLLADEFKGYLKSSCGGDNILATEVEYEGTDFGKAQQDDPNVILQLKLANVTTVLMLTEPIQPLFQIQAAKQQNYYPEWVFSSFGYADSNTVQRLYDQDEMKGSMGTSNLGIYGGFGFGAGDPFYMYHSLHPKGDDGATCDPSSDAGMNHPGCKAPTALVTWYYTMLPAIGGMLFAGPDLTPTNVTNGLQSYPTTRYGGNGPTSDPRPALVGAGRGKFGFIVDAVEWRWRPDFKSPQPENKDHWVEYPDCQRHYVQWPNDLAPNWEKNGPNYGAWCGDKNGYPRTLPDDGNH